VRGPRRYPLAGSSGPASPWCSEPRRHLYFRSLPANGPSSGLRHRFQISYPKGELTGKVKYCLFREIGYFLGVEFDPGSRWTEREFKPQHLLDPRRLVFRADADHPDTPAA
jgi:hypothetical protein